MKINKLTRRIHRKTETLPVIRYDTTNGCIKPDHGKCIHKYCCVLQSLKHGLQSLPPSPKRAERKGRRRPFREAGSGHKQWNTVSCVDTFSIISKGSLTLAMGKCLWFSVKIKVCQSSLFSPWSYPDLSTLWLWNPFSILNSSKM